MYALAGSKMEEGKESPGTCIILDKSKNCNCRKTMASWYKMPEEEVVAVMMALGPPTQVLRYILQEQVIGTSHLKWLNLCFLLPRKVLRPQGHGLSNMFAAFPLKLANAFNIHELAE